MPSNKVLEAQLRAKLAAARHRHEELQHQWGTAKYTSSGSSSPESVDVELAAVEAAIVELEENLAGTAAPAPAELPPAPAPANDARPAEAVPALPEYLTAREAAEFLRLSTDTLERLRQRPDGPPFKRVGRRVLYQLAGLREYGNRK